MYAVMGITGQVGGAVARTLLAAGSSVRAVVRDAGKGRIWAEQGCDIAVADMNDPAALARAFAGTEGVFAMLPPSFAPSPGFPKARAIIAALHAALLDARPGRIVCLSTIGAQATRPNLLNALGIMERVLGDLPVPIAFLRAAWFMENAAHDVASARERGVVPSYLQPLDRKLPMVATADIGRVAAELLLQDWTGPRTVELAGPRPVAPNDIAAGFSKVLGRPVRMEAVPRETWATALRAGTAADPTLRMQMLDGFNEGWIAFEHEDAQILKGKVELETVLRSLVG